MAVEIIITLMELLYLDTILMQRFYQYAPNSRSWDYIAKQRSPLTIRVTEARGRGGGRGECAHPRSLRLSVTRGPPLRWRLSGGD